MSTPAVRRSAGFTLIEVLVTVGILAVAFFLMQLGINLLTGLFFQKTTLEGHRDASIVLYRIVRDVRGCQRIVSIAPDQLVINVFDPRGRYDTNNFDFFDPANIATATYRYVQESSGSYLSHVLVTSNNTREARFLSNRLIPVSNDDYLFRHYKGIPITDPEVVEIALRVKHPDPKGQPKIYQAEAMKRAREAD